MMGRLSWQDTNVGYRNTSHDHIGRVDAQSSPRESITFKLANFELSRPPKCRASSHSYQEPTENRDRQAGVSYNPPGHGLRRCIHTFRRLRCRVSFVRRRLWLTWNGGVAGEGGDGCMLSLIAGSPYAIGDVSGDGGGGGG
jgi:hypothetical protein